jgi:phenol hydroxylase P5 protein
MSIFLEKNIGRIIESKFLSTKIKSITIQTEAELNFTPGQYLIIMIGGKIPRNYSIANYDLKSPTTKFQLLVNIANNGVGARTLRELDVNDPIEFYGPIGDFKIIEGDEKENWFICVGSGVSPLIPMIRQLQMKNKKTRLFFGVRDKEDLIDFSFINTKVEYSLSNKDTRWSGFKGRIYDHVVEEIEKSSSTDKNDRKYYICGIPDMAEDTKRKLKTYGILKKNIVFEEY